MSESFGVGQEYGNNEIEHDCHIVVTEWAIGGMAHRTYISPGLYQSLVNAKADRS
jgi:hypothetical protein